MRKVFGIGIALALAAAFVLLGGLPPRATAQGGGTIEAEVKYGGAPQVETIKVNKDVEQCGKEKKIEKVAVGPNKGLANAVVSVADAKGPTTGKPVSLSRSAPARR